MGRDESLPPTVEPPAAGGEHTLKVLGRDAPPLHAADVVAVELDDELPRSGGVGAGLVALASDSTRWMTVKTSIGGLT